MADKDLLPDTLASTVREDVQAWESSMGEWVEEARDSFALVAGDQWTDTDAQTMNEQKRPMVTMNRIAAMIRGVCGLEVSQRMEARYLARDMGDVPATEIQNSAARWVREGCNAEDEESDAFRDMLITGIGWTETRVDYDEEPDGKILIERVDPLQMRWDPLAIKRGLQDRRWCARIKTMAIDDVKRQWPEKADEIVAHLEDNTLEFPLHSNNAGDGYTGSGTGAGGKIKDEVTVVQYQHFEHEYYVKVTDPASGQTVDLPQDRYAELAKLGVLGAPVARYKKRIYKQAITCGPVILEHQELKTSNFTFNCMTGTRDRNKGIWYGLVRDLKDPQRWSNKFFSTVIDTLATNAKGGVMAETTAVEDVRKFEEDWSNPRSTVWLRAGGLQKILPRPGPNIPNAMGQVMEFAVNSMPHVAGINLEFLGMADRDQPGVLEYQRKQAVASSLAEFFSALRQYRKVQGLVLLEMIFAYIADGRMIRIVGKEGEQYMPLYRKAEVRYDVVVDEAATAPDRKMQTWLAVMELLPVALKTGLPVPPSILDYSPLPQALQQEWKRMLSESPKVPEAVQQQLEEGAKLIQKLQQENAALKDKRAEKEAEFALKMQEQQLERDQAQAMIQIEREKAQSEIQIEREKAQNEIMLEREKAVAEVQLEREKAVLAASVKEQLGLANIDAQYTFERKGRKITGVKDHTGASYAVDRDAGGNIIGLRAATTRQ